MDRSEPQQPQPPYEQGGSPVEDIAQPTPDQAEDVKGGLFVTPVTKDETIPIGGRTLSWDHDFELRP